MPWLVTNVKIVSEITDEEMQCWIDHMKLVGTHSVEADFMIYVSNTLGEEVDELELLLLDDNGKQIELEEW